MIKSDYKARRNKAYQLHYKLRKKGNTVKTKQRMVVTRSINELTKTELKHINILATEHGYGVCQDLFNN